ncbi:HNH endonuclease [Photobacterium toruni]|uniref:HNH endonuclease n=1 Tax=Photobacterium toruni TaxID=1935446 RepID=UPI00210F4D68|nr:HNH endonuclease [Photobacterium toruni]
MRPVRRGSSPSSIDFNPYGNAKTDIISRISLGIHKGKEIGFYCSYCERRIATNLAIEHIQPKKGPHSRPDLKGCWENFLLSCVNCNSSKSNKSVFFDYFFFPDRDNTFLAFDYLPNGEVIPSECNSLVNKILASNTLSLLGLDKGSSDSDSIAKDRISQRREIWATAQSSLYDYEEDITNQAVKNLVVKCFLATGFFSVWMTVFDKHSDMKNLFIDSISGTRDSGCFDYFGNSTGSHPNQDGLKLGTYKNFNTQQCLI